MPITLNGTTGITTPSIDASAGNSALTTLSVGGNNISAVNGLWRNRIINGAMVVAQRGTSAVTSDSSFPVDRFKTSISGSAALSFQQSSTTPSGAFSNSVICTVTSGAAQGASGTFYRLFQVIEGYNTADLGWGASGAQSITVSFWVRSSVTGTYSGHLLESNSGSASYVFTYVINAANTWEYKTVTVVGPTIGTWQTTNSGSILLGFDLGSAVSTETTAGVWVASSNKLRAPGTVVLCATTSATFYITGVQLEAGSVATPFERRDYGRELMMCQRYFARVFDPPMRGAGTGGTSGGASRLGLWFPTTMRAQPTASINGTFNFWNGSSTATGTTLTSYFVGGYNGIELDITTSVAFSIGDAVCAYCTNNTTSKYVDLAAEL